MQDGARRFYEELMLTSSPLKRDFLMFLLRPVTEIERNADLFAILKSTEKLERAYVRDIISAKEYEPLCSKLIGQYKTLYESLRDQASTSSADGRSSSGCELRNI